MFESTLEAQALHEGERRLGTLSAAALAHVGIGVAIVAATALIVPPVHTPDAPSPVFVSIPNIPLDDVVRRPLLTPPPKKGTDAANPAKIVAPRATPDPPPSATPDRLPEAPLDTAAPGSDVAGEGTPGDPGGADIGILGGLGDGGTGPGADHGVNPVELTGDMVRPVLLVKVEPPYPRAARAAGLGERVTLRAVIAEDGSVESVEVLASTNVLFDEAAVDAVQKWRYRPALMNGKAIRVYFSVVVNFLVR